MFGPRLAKKIKEEIGAQVKDEEWERIKKGKNAESSLDHYF
jgi:dihydroorotate dehydrogenase